MPEPTHAFISNRFCPACGYELTGLAYSERVTCPECGTLLETPALLSEPPRGPVGEVYHILVERRKIIAIAATATVVASLLPGLVVASLGTAALRCGRPLPPEVLLEEIHLSCVLYPVDSKGRYPTHVAVLIPANYLSAEWFLDPRVGRSVCIVGGYDLLQYDGSPEATAALAAALESTDLDAPYYPLGDFWWVRLPGPTRDGSIIAGWSAPEVQGERKGGRWVVFDDGQVERVDRCDWRRLWRADTAARRKIGLTPVIPPPP